MGKQLVVSGNRIIAHGIDCFLSMGGTVICPDTGRTYQNATVVECEYFPGDIDSVGYEYHAGRFVPCAPYGIGNGNVAVVCNEDCKSIKDSGTPFDSITKVVETSYKGTGSTGAMILTFDKAPDMVIITGGDKKEEILGYGANGVSYAQFAIITPYGGLVFRTTSELANSGARAGFPIVSHLAFGTSIVWKCTDSTAVNNLNASGETYKVIALYR